MKNYTLSGSMLKSYPIILAVLIIGVMFLISIQGSYADGPAAGGGVSGPASGPKPYKKRKPKKYCDDEVVDPQLGENCNSNGPDPDLYCEDCQLVFPSGDETRPDGAGSASLPKPGKPPRTSSEDPEDPDPIGYELSTSVGPCQKTAVVALIEQDFESEFERQLEYGPFGSTGFDMVNNARVLPGDSVISLAERMDIPIEVHFDGPLDSHFLEYIEATAANSEMSFEQILRGEAIALTDPVRMFTNELNQGFSIKNDIEQNGVTFGNGFRSGVFVVGSVSQFFTTGKNYAMAPVRAVVRKAPALARSAWRTTSDVCINLIGIFRRKSRKAQPCSRIASKTLTREEELRNLFLERLGGESIGGNAGAGKAAVNIVVDNATGEIKYIGNYVDHDAIISRGVKNGCYTHLPVVVDAMNDRLLWRETLRVSGRAVGLISNRGRTNLFEFLTSFLKY